ncbi:MAG: GatB/YqeY domain-containing protein [Chlorobi bacterium]|nr:MAG: GatB/Yqey [Chlorobi bacterium OLB7]MBK8912471.1 GatB/YqeY domain-containing protein [Chlorobiota bacterium]MBX7216280.1 GatB/YqeY domain-containing protein [Candidatus Kapabacteria bacterium]
MTLTEKIANDMKEAMKSGEKVRLGTLRMVRAALLELQKSGNEVTPDLELRAVQKQANARKDAMEQFIAAGRNDLAENERVELEIIEAYLPQQLSDDDIRAKVREIIAQTGASGPNDFKLVMPKAMAAMRGVADGNRVQAVVRDALQS